MALRGTTVSLTSNQLSDLFFNHEKTHYDGLYESGEGPDGDAVYKALLQDATEFCQVIGLDAAEFADPLATDCMNRI